MDQDPPPTPWNLLRAIGVVFGDIGTSPIYTFSVILVAVPISSENLLGVLSLILWTLLTIVSLQYAWLALSLLHRGEGGSVALWHQLTQLLPRRQQSVWAILLLQCAIALLIGDSILTPAISILSAVEGIHHLPGLEGVDHQVTLVIAGVLVFLLFSLQRIGIDRIGAWFGPIMALWFASLGLLALPFLENWEWLLSACNPCHGLRFLLDNGWVGFLALSQVLLCATGGEAMFSDAGHVGRRPIRWGWALVGPCLALHYMGQADFVLHHHAGAQGSILLHMVQHTAPSLYVAFLLLMILATAIASQSVISGVTALLRQAINIRLFPPLRMEHTSDTLASQVYLPSLNWILCLAVLGTLALFPSVERLSIAYGLAVIATMTISAIFLLSIFWRRKQPFYVLCAFLLLGVDLCFLSSTMHKLLEGAYWSLLLAAFPFGVLCLYREGLRRLMRQHKPIPFVRFLPSFEGAYQKQTKIPGTALFACACLEQVPQYVADTLFEQAILYETTLLIEMSPADHAEGIEVSFSPDPTPGLRLLRILYGYREEVDLSLLLEQLEIEPTVIFYSAQEIISDAPLWKLFGIMRRLSPSWARFYHAPQNVTRGILRPVAL